MEIPKKKWESLVKRVEALERGQREMKEMMGTLVVDACGGPEEVNELLFGDGEIDDED